MTSKPLVSRTLATLRSAEFGFFGVVVYTRVHTPRFCGEEASAGTLDFQAGSLRPVRINWVVVAINTFRGPPSLIRRSPETKLNLSGARQSVGPEDKGRRL